MSKTYIVSRNGGTVSKAPVNDNKIPIYDNETALDADLANIPDNTLVATKEGKFDVDDMKDYIRKQNVLSDWESITLSTDSNNPTVMQHDGFYLAIVHVQASADSILNLYINNTLRVRVSSGGSYTTFRTTINIPFKKGDTLYCTKTQIDTQIESVAYYKDRDYTDR